MHAEAAVASAAVAYADDAPRHVELLLLYAELHLAAGDPARVQPLLEACEALARETPLDAGFTEQVRAQTAHNGTRARLK